MDERYDIVICGAGPIGTALALALRDSGLRIALLETKAFYAGPDDERSIAISYGSRLIFERLGVWPALAPGATAICDITVTQQRAFGRVELSARDVATPALGYVIAYATLQRELRAAVDHSAISVFADQTVTGTEVAGEEAAVFIVSGEQRSTMYASLVVLADGGAGVAPGRFITRDYHQTALVCGLASQRPHHNRAYERFTVNGPAALLPSARGWSLIWTTRPAHAQQLAELDDGNFCKRVEELFGGTCGRFSALGSRQTFPLALKYALAPIAGRTVLVGNAAQVLHPIAGQGYNLGLRDVWELARAIVADPRARPGSDDMLTRFFSRRRADRIATIVFTDSLIQLFCKEIPLLNAMRGLSLAALNGIPGAKKFLTRRMMFGTRG